MIFVFLTIDVLIYGVPGGSRVQVTPVPWDSCAYYRSMFLQVTFLDQFRLKGKELPLRSSPDRMTLTIMYISLLVDWVLTAVLLHS